MTTLRSWRLLLALCLFVPGPIGLLAQQPAASPGPDAGQAAPGAAKQQETQPDATPQETKPETTNKKEGAKKKKASGPLAGLVVAPVPISNPAIGTGAIFGVGYIFPISKKDKVSPPSVVGAAGLFTNDGSRAWGLGGQLYFKKNTYNTAAFYGKGNLNYDLYGSGVFTGLKLPLEQTGQGFEAEILRKIGWKFFVGPRGMAGDSFITVRPVSGSVPPLPPDVGFHTTLTAIGAKVTRDTTVNRFYPTGNTIFSFTSDFFAQALGGKYTFQSYKANFNKYWSWGENRVLVYNGYGCSTGGTPPFYANCIYGNGSELRGYVAGKYFDRHMVATQLEYRWAFPYHLGVVGFGGIGEAIRDRIKCCSATTVSFPVAELA